MTLKAIADQVQSNSRAVSRTPEIDSVLVQKNNGHSEIHFENALPIFSKDGAFLHRVQNHSRYPSSSTRLSALIASSFLPDC